ncbi:hypothetical protein RRF68_08020 [Tenacibaculum sp. HL-MS23]|uniref:hypothetical protein n=1 Tax=Tenacibaculum sp. HL-MS23 TaxID=3077734 RepID=UPI0028FC3067|nr:hypothetical protein [Tenacibaculum sp. HL-MS23]WNW00942.1 hypothetical protein RRF68_08020 [Tenacibaculum sp. HL-MS23]
MYSPLTKQLLKTYVSIQYQENADFSDESLKQELIWLYENNELDELILAEYLTSEPRQIAIANGN